MIGNPFAFIRRKIFIAMSHLFQSAKNRLCTTIFVPICLDHKIRFCYLELQKPRSTLPKTNRKPKIYDNATIWIVKGISLYFRNLIIKDASHKKDEEQISIWTVNRVDNVNFISKFAEIFQIHFHFNRYGDINYVTDLSISIILKFLYRITRRQ